MAGLTEVRIQKELIPKGKLYRVADAAGLCLEVHPGGGRYWRFRYRFAGKAKMISVGTYPEISLKEARNERDKARQSIREGIDPSVKRRLDEVARRAGAATTFERVAREWLTKQKGVLAPSTFDKAEWLLEELAFPWLGNRPIRDIEPPEMLAVLQRVEERGKIETAHRLKQKCSQVFRYAIATARATRDPCSDLRGALTPVKVTNRAAITDPSALGALLRAIDGYSGSLVTVSALRLAPLVFVRPGELRKAEWAEFDLEAAEWKIPAGKMKMKRPHIVPLCRQAVEILRVLQPLTRRSRYVFPSVRSAKNPMSENTVLAALRRMGYAKEEMTGHGFRSTASTRLHEKGWPTEVVERQLAHVEKNKVKAAYNHAEHLPERRRMMQEWADDLDVLKGVKGVVETAGQVAA
jgi:integrase